MDIRLAQVRNNADILQIGQFLANCGGNEVVTVKYVTPYLADNYGGFIAIPEVGSDILICKPTDSNEWYYMGSILQPNVGEVFNASRLKNPKGLLPDERLYKGRGRPNRQTFSSPKGNKLVLSDENSPDYGNIKAEIQSSLGKVISLNDSPGIDSIIIRDEEGNAMIKISSKANGSSAAKSIELECVGPVKIFSRESDIELTVVDGKEINILNKSSASKRAGPSDPTPGNINITSEKADINILAKDDTGMVRIQTDGNNSHIVLDSKGTVQIRGEKGISLVSNGDIIQEGNTIQLNP